MGHTDRGEQFVFLLMCMRVHMRVCMGRGLICACACVSARAGFGFVRGPFVFLFPPQKERLGFCVSFVEFAETQCQTVAPVERSRQHELLIKTLHAQTPTPKTLCLRLRLHYHPSNIARGHIVKYGTHTKGIYSYNRNGYGYQNLLHINA